MPKFLNLSRKGLKYLDVLTYITIRSFYSTAKGYAYPPYEAIMERSGLGRTFIAGSIKRLEKAGYLYIWHSIAEGACNRYYFGKLQSFALIPYSIFEASDLTIYQKSMLLCLKQFFVHGCHSSDNTVKQFAKQLGVTYQQVYKPYKELIAKGYIVETTLVKTLVKEKSVGKALTSKLNWNFHEVLNIPVVDIINMLPKEKGETSKNILKVA